MIKRTMQEWADFTGCYVAKSKMTGDIWLHDGKPIIDTDLDVWNGVPACLLAFFDVERADYIETPIIDAKDHDWRVLVEPKGEKNESK